MTEQKCVRTYTREGYKEKSGCEDLNSYLECGWKIVMVTPNADYNEYIIEREVGTSRKEIEK